MSAAEPVLARCCAGLYELPIVVYLLGQSFHPGGAKLTRQLANASLVSPDSRVLDVACGIGSSARIIAADFGATVTGCDYSALNLERASAASRKIGHEKKIRFVRGNAERLPFASESFDVTLCECSLCLFEKMDIALQQLHRVLKPGGRIGISDFFLNAPIPSGLDNLAGKVLCIADALSVDGYRAALSRAGFKYVRIRIVNWTLTDMIQQIRHRLELLTTTNAADGIRLPADLGGPAPVLKDLERFIASGGAGYLIASARRL